MTDLHRIAGDMHADAAGWDPRRTAFEMVRSRLAKIDSDRVRVGQARLVDADLTVQNRVNAIGAALSGPQGPESVAAAAAMTVALLMFMLKAEDASPFTGGEAA